MAGGEGTRLRPLTSNAPKPMMPLANRADDGAHRRPAEAARLRRDRRHRRLHGQPHPHLLRRRLRVRRADGLRHRGDAARHRRLGAQRHGRARRALPRDLRRRAHRHRPRRDRRRFHDEREALATIGLAPRREPARVRHRHHPRRRLHRALPREADVGPGVQRHHQHRHLRARARDLRLHRAPTGRSTSPARCSRRCSTTASRSSARSPRATGRTSARSRPTCAAHKDILDGKVAGRRSPASRWATACWLGEGAEIHPDATHRRARPSSATTAASRPAPASGEYTVLGTNVRVRADADLERVVVHDNAYLGEGVRLRGADRSAGPATCAAASAARRAWCSATSASSASTPCSAPA